MSHEYLKEGKVVKGGRNPLNTSDERPPTPKGSGVAIAEQNATTVKDCTIVNCDTAKPEPKSTPKGVSHVPLPLITPDEKCDKVIDDIEKLLDEDDNVKPEPTPPPYLANERRLWDYRDLRSGWIKRMIPLWSEAILILLSAPQSWMIIKWKYGDAGGDKLISWEKYTDTDLVRIDTMVKALVGNDYRRDTGV